MLVAAGLFLTIVTSNPDRPVYTKQLSTKTRPFYTPPGLYNGNIVSVSESKTKGSIYSTRIYRYTFHGSFAKWVIGYRKTLTPRDGWKQGWSDTNEVDFWRDLPHGPIAKQGLILAATRLVKDKRSPFGWSPALPVVGRGWIWISYNETLRRPTPKSSK